MEEVFQILLTLIHKVPWASEWEQTGIHKDLADAWEKVAKLIGVDTTADGYVAPVSPPPVDAPTTAAPGAATLPSGRTISDADVAAIAAALKAPTEPIAAAAAAPVVEAPVVTTPEEGAVAAPAATFPGATSSTAAATPAAVPAPPAAAPGMSQ